MASTRDYFIGLLFAIKGVQFAWDHREGIVGFAIGWKPTRRFGMRSAGHLLLGPFRDWSGVGKIAVDEFISRPLQNFRGKKTTKPSLIKGTKGKPLTARIAGNTGRAAVVGAEKSWGSRLVIGGGRAARGASVVGLSWAIMEAYNQVAEAHQNNELIQITEPVAPPSFISGQITF